ncbi:hypothetical protein [Thermoleptolyngbya oregonensis]|nr:hypothetical protein [Thermoleptolyngbya oregonensis]
MHSQAWRSPRPEVFFLPFSQTARTARTARTEWAQPALEPLQQI